MSGETEVSPSGWTIDTLKAYIEARLDASDKALELRTSEIDRRLLILNHAHEQAVEVQATYVPRELFEAFVGTFAEYKEVTNRALILREGQSHGVGSTLTVIIGAVGFIATVLGIVAVLVTMLR